MVENPAEVKRKLRSSFLDARSQEQVVETAADFGRIAIQLIDRLGAKRVGCYLSFGTEPSTSEIIRLMSERGIEVFAPRVAAGEMKFTLLGNELERNPLGFDQPLDSQEARDLDLVIAPAVAADLSGFRLGRGGGYFDRYLSRSNVTTAALVFENEVVPSLPTEPHDLRVNFVITERREIDCHPAIK